MEDLEHYANVILGFICPVCLLHQTLGADLVRAAHFKLNPNCNLNGFNLRSVRSAGQYPLQIKKKF